MQARLRRLSTVVVAASVAGVILLPAAGGANRDRRGQLERESRSLGSRSTSAVLELYALDAKLEQTGGQLARVRARAVALAAERAAVRTHLGIARRTLARSETLLAHRVRTLYEQHEADPLEIVLGAASLEEAVSRLDALRAAGQQDRMIVEQTRAARRSLKTYSRAIARRTESLRRLERSVAAEAAALAHVRLERSQYLAELTAQRRLTDAEIASLERSALTARSHRHALTSGGQADAATADVQPDLLGRRTIIVQASGYALTGHTASGMPVAWGVVAVDPAVIPLGTRMTIPGYGNGVAADLGAAVRGSRIDLWFPTRARALAWGRRTVTVTLH